MAPASAGLGPREFALEAQEKAAEGVRLELARDYSAAYAAYVKAGQCCLWLVRYYASDNAKRRVPPSTLGSEKKRFTEMAKTALHRAELIKRERGDIKPVRKQLTDIFQQSQALAFGQQHHSAVCLDQSDLLEGGSKDYSQRLAECTANLVIQQPDLPPQMRETGVVFKSIKDIDGAFVSEDYIDRDWEIVQDAFNDCSLVAGMIACKEFDARRGTTLLPSLVTDSANTIPAIIAAEGKYAVRFHHNGVVCYVVVDDKLPCSQDGKVLCARSVRKDGTGRQDVRPGVIEKAYFSLRGSYESRGSDSSIDIHALTGMLPQQMGFRHGTFRKEEAWDCVHQGFYTGSVLITAGTGKAPPSMDTDADMDDFFIDSHDYAVVDMRQDVTGRFLTLINPWRRDNAISYKERTRTLTWDEACEKLDSIFLNADSSVPLHSATLHATWPRPAKASTSCVRRCEVLLEVPPQAGKDTATLWLHLARHVKYSTDLPESPKWIALNVTSGHLSDDQSLHAGRFVDSPHIATVCALPAGKHHVVVSLDDSINNTDLQDSSRPDVSFTLSAYADRVIRYVDSPEEYPFRKELEWQWTSRTSGGNMMCETFVDNPQYLLQVPANVTLATDRLGGRDVRLVVESSRDIPLHILVVWAPRGTSNTSTLRSRRVDHVAQADIITSSGNYAYGHAIAKLGGLRPGSELCVIVSTYGPEHTGDYKLTLESTEHALLDAFLPIPSEGAGKHHHRMHGSWRSNDGTACGGPRHGNFMSNPSITFGLTKRAVCSFRLRATGQLNNPQRSIQPRPQINLSIFERLSGREVASSGPYHDNVCGACIREVMLEPSEYVLIASTFTPDINGEFIIDAYTEIYVTYTRLK